MASLYAGSCFQGVQRSKSQDYQVQVVLHVRLLLSSSPELLLLVSYMWDRGC